MFGGIVEPACLHLSNPSTRPETNQPPLHSANTLQVCDVLVVLADGLADGDNLFQRASRSPWCFHLSTKRYAAVVSRSVHIMRIYVNQTPTNTADPELLERLRQHVDNLADDEYVCAWTCVRVVLHCENKTRWPTHCCCNYTPGGSLQLRDTPLADSLSPMASANDDAQRIAQLEQIWHDITPAQDTPASTTVASIQYTTYHRHLLQYLRAIANTPERSHRVLDLTTSVIEATPASYTAWQLRWECLCALGMSLEEELGDNADVVADNPKNYQDWNHRRKCFDVLGVDFGIQVWSVSSVRDAPGVLCSGDTSVYTRSTRITPQLCLQHAHTHCNSHHQ